MKKIIITLIFTSLLLISCGKTEEINIVRPAQKKIKVQETQVENIETASGLIEEVSSGSTSSGIISKSGAASNNLDANSVFLSSLQNLGNEYYKDSSNIYFNNRGTTLVMTGASPKDINISKDGNYLISNKKIFCWGQPIDNINATSVKFLGSGLLKDNKSVFSACDKIDADLNSFEVINESMEGGFVLAKDKNSYFYNARGIYRPVNKIDVDYNTFKILDDSYAVDKNKVYSFGDMFSAIENADVLSFQILGKGKAKDINNTYDFGMIINTGLSSNKGTGNKISTTFSDSQIQDILSKIDENTKKKQELEKNSTGTLVQGDFKAEYITPKDYSKDTDKIIVTLSGKRYEIPGVYGKEEIKKYIKCYNDREKDGGEKLSQNSLTQQCGFYFGNFIQFSPSGLYLLIGVGGWEYYGARLIDAKNGKVIINEINGTSFYAWTKDNKRFVYGLNSAFFGSDGLYITQSGNFPKTYKITEGFIEGGYLDENNIYVITNTDKRFIKIYDLNTLKEIYSKEIK